MSIREVISTRSLSNEALITIFSAAILFAYLPFGVAGSAQTRVGDQKADKSPHRSRLVLANGIRLHYLDWGGKGETLLLLTGFGNDAHIFDSLAPQLTDCFHVIGLTRRGWGESDKPKSGYDIESRVDDIRAFLDALKIKRANLVGHSMAGDEMTRFGSLYPDRVMKIVYLDAAYDRRHADEVTLGDPALTPFWRRLVLEIHNSPEASNIEVKDMPPADTWERYKAMIHAMAIFQPDYKKIKAPALAIYAVPATPPIPPNADEATRKRINDWFTNQAIPYTRASIDQFRREAQNGQIIEMQDATHYLFLGKTQPYVVRQIREFLLRQ